MINDHRLSCCRLQYLTLSKSWSGPSKAYSFVSLLFKLLAAKYTFGGPGRNRTAVQHAFYPKELQQFLTGFIIQAHQKHTLVIVLFTFTQNPLPGLRLSMLLMSYMFSLFWSIRPEIELGTGTWKDPVFPLTPRMRIFLLILHLA